MADTNTNTPANVIEFRGKQANSLRFERTVQQQGGEPSYTLRFFDGRKQVERVDGVKESDLANLVGSENADSLKTYVVDRSEPIEGGGRGFGVLKGDKLKGIELAAENSIEPSPEIDKDVRNWVTKRWGEREAPSPATQDNDDPFAAESRDSVADVNTSNDAGEPGGTQYRRVDRDRLLTPVPNHIARRFAQGEKNQYYFDQQRQKLAFVDKGLRLETKDASPVVAESLVGIAMARGWETMRVKGSKDFKREVWLAAELAGAEVIGYDPTEADKELLERKLEERGMPKREAAQRAHVDVNTIEPVAEADKTAENGRGAAGKRGPNPDASQEAENGAADAIGNIVGALAGKVLAHGSAHYQHDKNNDMNYFVRLELANGKEREVWGKDLSRAMREGNADVGDTVTLNRIGQKPVIVTEAVRDDDGKVVGGRSKDAVLNGWSVEKAKDFRTLDPAHSLAKHPDLLDAHATMATTANALANKYPNMADSIKEKFRERLAEKIERKETIPVPKVSAAKIEPKQQTRAALVRAPDRAPVPDKDLER